MNLTNKFWESTYRKNISKMIGVCYRYVPNKQLAEDLAHDAFIRAMDKAESFTGKGNFDAWLCRININNALQHLRKQQANSFLEDIVIHENTLMENSKEEDDRGIIEMANFTENELLDTINILPEHHRLVFNLYVIDKYSHIQIAEELGISVGTSKSHLSRARKKLQIALQTKAQEKQHTKNWKRALFAFILPAKSQSIDQLFQQQFWGFKILPKNPISLKVLSASKATIPVIKSAIITTKSAIIAGVSTTVAIPAIIVGVNTIQIESNNTETLLLDSSNHITLVQDTIQPSIKADSVINAVFLDTIIKKSPVVVKRKIIKKNVVVVKKPVIMKDTINEI